MAFGGFNDNQPQAPMADINVTPMVDVMLVLLVIFIITAPLFTHSIALDLPSAQAAPTQEKPDTISLSIDGKGKIFWNDEAIEQKSLDEKLAQMAKKVPMPELQLRADKETRYEVVAQVMAAAQANGLNRLGFVTNPKEPQAKTQVKK